MIFKRLAGKRFGNVDLECWNRHYIETQFPDGVPEENPSLRHEFATAMVNAFHQTTALDWSYDGWGGWRENLWRNSYLEEDRKFLHLGTDFNVPAGTEVSCQWPLDILKIDSHKERFGWGNRVIGRVLEAPGEAMVLMYAHLADHLFYQEQDVVRAGLVFGKVGKPAENGRWFPHLHVQAMTLKDYNALTERQFAELDGYGRAEDREELLRRFPDPLNIISLL